MENEVSVIGLGVLGSALARTLLRSDYRVTVWNRTSAKAEPLVRDGAVLAPSAAAAVGASPIVLVCVEDYRVTCSILGTKEAASALVGRVLVELSTGTPRTHETPRLGRGSEASTISMVPSWRLRVRSAGRTLPFLYRVRKTHSGRVNRFSRPWPGI